MIFEIFNHKNKTEREESLLQCCGSQTWVNKLQEGFPYESERAMLDRARRIWYQECTESDYLEAFTHHPKIGDVESLKKKFASTAHLASNEQGAVAHATEGTILKLAEKNKEYEDKNGFIFIVCATGKSASEMLDLLQYRLAHNTKEEINVAKGEQFKITVLRLRKLLDLQDPEWKAVSHVTTHVLDTSIGTPGKNLAIAMKENVNGEWMTKCIGVTNSDGRIPDLLPPSLYLEPGHYKMVFHTGDYFQSLNLTGFYPEVTIDFTIFDDTHYHVPLLINPFGYSTYRGS